MAENSLQDGLPTKRPLANTVEALDHPPKKVRRTYHHHHQIRHEFKGIPPECEPTFLNDDQIDILLKKAITVQCQGYGFEKIDSLALDRFRSIVEEYVFNFTCLVRQSMLACRRVQPLYVDFEWAFERTKVPEPYREDKLPFEELEHDLRTPFNPNLPPLLPTPPPDDKQPPSLDDLALRRNGTADRKNGFVPLSFPALPAPHAYKQSEVYPKREDDPRKIRELATEEGRMGEQALRKLAGATRMETKVDVEEGQKRVAGNKYGWSRPGKKEIPMEEMFENTMQSLMRQEMNEHPELKIKGEELKFELGPIVNWERRYYMQPNVSGVRKSGNSADSNAGSSTKGRDVLKTDAMDLS